MSAPLPRQESLPAIGPGSLQPGLGIPDPQSLIKSSGTGTGQAAEAGGIPGAAFMGVKDNATRVVFIVDSSGSMQQHRAMDAAKAALVSSISSLEAGQQFQVIFYNEFPRTMTLRSAPRKQLYFATDFNKQWARQFINQIQPDLGTHHLDAIKLGLSFGAEVMFVLTESGDPQLTPRELAEIERRNAGRTRIHSIEFGVGPELKGAGLNFLVKLANQNDGTHRYVDVTQFSRR
jgi:Ca-activated chloride channel family protein